MLSTMVLTAALALPSQSDAPSPRLRQYLALAEATLRQPIRPGELEAALLSPAGVRAFRTLFERSLEESLVASGTLVTPELGGEATLDAGRLALVDYPDPVHPLIREMAGLEAEPARLLERLSSTPEGKHILSGTGGLHALLYQMANSEPTDAQRALLGQVLDGAVATHFKTWSTDPAIQARMIETTDWRGRYVGFWHIHPPRLRAGALGPGIEPSVADMTNAMELGQFLTVVFQPDGFDAYDLSGLAGLAAPDLRRARVTRYRSPDWKEAFEALVRTRLECSMPWEDSRPIGHARFRLLGVGDESGRPPTAACLRRGERAGLAPAFAKRFGGPAIASCGGGPLAQGADAFLSNLLPGAEN